MVTTNMDDLVQDPIILPLGWVQGDDYSVDLVVKVGAPLTPIVWAGATVNAYYATPRGSETPLEFLCTPGADGDLNLYLTEAETLLTEVGKNKYVWWLVITKDDYTLTYAKGNVEVLKRRATVTT
jgi:hypothetical protein